MAAEIALTTMDRVANYLDVGIDDIRDSGDMVIPGMISAVSNSIANLCNRDFSVRRRQERRRLAKPTFFLSDGPARSILSVRSSPSNRITADGTDLPASAYELDFDGLKLSVDPGFVAGCVWEVTYIGGLAYSTNLAQYAATAVGTVGLASYTFTDHRVMQITAWAGGLVTFIAEAGSFREGDVLDLGGGNTLTLGAVVQESICNDFPDLEQAALMQISNLWQRHKSLGRTSLDMGNGATSFVKDYDLLPGVRTLLTKYSRPFTWL